MITLHPALLCRMCGVLQQQHARRTVMYCQYSIRQPGPEPQHDRCTTLVKQYKYTMHGGAE